jgi:hypothetical protein
MTWSPTNPGSRCPGRAPSLLLLALALSLPVLPMAGCTGEVPEDTVDPGPPEGAVTLEYRQFSTSPSLAWGQGSTDPMNPDYGALSFFREAVAARTEPLGDDRMVVLALAPGTATVADVAAGEATAAHVSGGSLSPAWGFLVNSIPFGPEFSEMVTFLYDAGGLELVNESFRDREMDVVVLPVVGSSEQLAGYFRKPLGVPSCPEGDEECLEFGDGIGISGLCAEPWTLRYLPPAETILDRACQELGGPRRMDFVQAIPGGSAFLTAVQEGTIDGFEFATPLDDHDAARGGFFANPSAPEGSDGRNLGEIGLRYIHHPGWHQPFFLGWMAINRSQFWDQLDGEQQAAIREAGRQALMESFQATDSVQCHYMERIMDATRGTTQRTAAGDRLDASAEMVLTRWRDEDVELLKSVAVQVLEDARGGATPTRDEAEYRRILSALLDHLGHDSVREMMDGWFGADGSSPLAECLTGPAGG